MTEHRPLYHALVHTTEPTPYRPTAVDSLCSTGQMAQHPTTLFCCCPSSLRASAMSHPISACRSSTYLTATGPSAMLRPSSNVPAVAPLFASSTMPEAICLFRMKQAHGTIHPTRFFVRPVLTCPTICALSYMPFVGVSTHSINRSSFLFI